MRRNSHVQTSGRDGTKKQPTNLTPKEPDSVKGTRFCQQNRGRMKGTFSSIFKKTKILENQSSSTKSH